jgi:hypothetical protein
MPIDEWLPGSVGVVLCLGLAAWFGRLGFFAVNAQRWPSVPGRVVSSVVVLGRRQSGRARVRYEYQVGAQKFTGQTLFFGDFLDANPTIARERASAHPVGGEVTVRHHPDKPSVSYVEARADLRVWLFLGGAMLLAGVILKALVRGE